MRIFIGSDHAGLAHKAEIIKSLKNSNYDVIDCGAFEYDENDDYPNFVSKVAKEISQNPANSRGIVLGGSGEGEAMAANRFHKVRATVFYGKKTTIPGDHDVIELARSHNDANILSIGARFVTVEEAIEAVNEFLEVPFLGEERHKRRISEIDHTHE